MHTKAGPYPVRVECPLYHQSEADQLIALHDDAPSIEAPSQLVELRHEWPETVHAIGIDCGVFGGSSTDRRADVTCKACLAKLAS